MYVERTGDMVRTFVESVDEGTKLVITTNGYVNSRGEAVMGRGCARQVKDLYPGFAKRLGRELLSSGNHVRYFPREGIITFPVKHDWHQRADLLLIARSFIELYQMLHRISDIRQLWMPRPGCGNGGLDWNTVKPLTKAFAEAVSIPVTVWHWR